MPAPNSSKENFVKQWNIIGSNGGFAKTNRLDPRNVRRRKQRLEEEGFVFTPLYETTNLANTAYKLREEIEIDNGVAIIVSDRHKWPDDGITPAEAAAHTLIPLIQPDVFIMNGDIFDGAGLSRHPPLGWEEKPSAAEEIESCKSFMARIEDLLPAECLKMRTVGNHDRRWDYALAKAAGEFKGVEGFRLSDHFPNWTESWSIHINRDVPSGYTVVKHKHRQGVGAARNNALSSGVTIVTGHTHALSCVAVETYRGRHWGVECGFLSTRDHAAFEYTEDAPTYARPGFAVLTWRNGILQPPELVELDDANVAWFRGEPVATEKPRYRVKAVSQRT